MRWIFGFCRIKISIETNHFKVYFDLGKDFSGISVHGSDGAEAEEFGEAPLLPGRGGRGKSFPPEKIKLLKKRFIPQESLWKNTH